MLAFGDMYIIPLMCIYLRYIYYIQLAFQINNFTKSQNLSNPPQLNPKPTLLPRTAQRPRKIGASLAYDYQRLVIYDVRSMVLLQLTMSHLL
jgi:hypothetical protein